MKKIVLLSLFLTSYFISAQEQNDPDQLEYNKWSIEVSAGFHKPTRPFAAGYKTSTLSFGQVSLGSRYMFNNRFGLKLDFGYSTIKEGDKSLPFDSNYYRGSLQGVANLGSIMRFETFTDRIGLLFHAGGGYSRLVPNEPLGEFKGEDHMMSVIAGITPQIRLSNRVALTTDLSVVGNVQQNYSWDGTEAMGRTGFDGLKVNVSAGLTFYLGKNDRHVDWVPEDSTIKEKIELLDGRVSKIETDLIDTDQDGVPDYLDREPNTMSGVAVNTKGIAIDKNKNGIPDEIESSLDERYSTKEEIKNIKTNSAEELLNNGYVNVYFRFNSDQPETYSLNAINYLIKYMNENPNAKAELIGYADELGNTEYNQKLSEKRAKRVYNILLASGVDESRLTYTGGGEDTSVDKSSAPARQLVRRVTFKLK